MLNDLIVIIRSKLDLRRGASRFHLALPVVAAAVGLALCLISSGCESPSMPPIPVGDDQTNSSSLASLTLHEGDTVQVRFPGSPDLDTAQAIRADGKITFTGTEDVKISGLTTEEAGKAILKVVGPKIKIQEVTVTVQSSAFIVYLTGAVGRPGKLVSDRPLTVFQAVIESGTLPTSNLKKVKVIRIDKEGHNTYKTLNLQKIIDGEVQGEPFNLRPYDTIFVPEKFSWF